MIPGTITPRIVLALLIVAMCGSIGVLLGAIGGAIRLLTDLQ